MFLDLICCISVFKLILKILVFLNELNIWLIWLVYVYVYVWCILIIEVLMWGCRMLMWEDGYCRGRGGLGDCYGEMEGEDLVCKFFSKMLI